jgi:hypothetical protein
MGRKQAIGPYFFIQLEIELFLLESDVDPDCFLLLLMVTVLTEKPTYILKHYCETLDNVEWLLLKCHAIEKCRILSHWSLV